MDAFLSTSTTDDDYPDWFVSQSDDDPAAPTTLKAAAGDDCLDLDSLLNLPSPDFDHYHSSPESSGSSHGAPAVLEFGGEVSWEGILSRPIFPQADESSPSSSSHAFSSPSMPVMAFDGSPVPSAQSAPTPPARVPAGGFPPFSMTSDAALPTQSSFDEASKQPAAVANPELSKLLASMAQYQAQYGTLLARGATPAATAVPTPVPAPHAPLPVAAPTPAPAVARPSFGTTTSASSSTSSSRRKASSTTSSKAHDDSHDDEEDDDMLHPLRSFRDSSVVSSSAGEHSGRPQMSAKAAAKRIAGGHLMSSVVVEDEMERGEGEEWRPTPEEYAKLDSKQKRQLRNKISAKNFRNRRKDYIDKLEGHLNERDRLLDYVREQMQRKEKENEELKREMAVLRNAVSMFKHNPASINAFGAGPSTQSQLSDASPSSTSSLPIDPFSSESASFWLNPIARNVALPPPTKPDAQPNLNPLLAQIPSLKQPASMAPQFADASSFSARQATVDQYRNQLWARLAHEAAYAGTGEAKPALKPLYFNLPAAEVKTFGPSVSRSSAGGIFPSLYPTAAASGPSAAALIASHAASEKQQADDDTAHLALLATVTQQTIASRLTSAFVDAFVAPLPLASATSTSSKPSRALDADKMASVLSGKSRLEVVPVDAPSPAKRECPSVSLEKALAALSLSFGGSGTCGRRNASADGSKLKKLSWREYICPSTPKDKLVSAA